MKTIFAAVLLTVAMTGTAIAGSDYKLAVDTRPAKVAARGSAKITVEPSAGNRMNLTYPTKITFTAPDGVTLEKSKLTAKDATKLDNTSAEFNVAYTAASPGRKTITAEIKFAVCTERSCDPKTERLSINIDVN